MTNDQFKQQLADALAFLHSSDEVVSFLKKRILSVKSVDEAFMIYELIDLLIDAKREISHYIKLVLSNKVSIADLLSYEFKKVDKVATELPEKLKLLKGLSDSDKPKILYH